MSKLAHSNDATMAEIEMRHWLEDEATSWHTAAIAAALKIAPLEPSTPGVELLFKELQEAGFFYEKSDSKWMLTKLGRKIALDRKRS